MYKSDDEVVRAVVVFAGLIIGQLFIYGGRIRDRKAITREELVADVMQYAAKYVACMATLYIIESFGMYKYIWSKLLYCILFTMSFDKWFARMREKFLARMGAVGDALLGKLPNDAVMEVPKGTGDSPAQVKATLMGDHTKTVIDEDGDGSEYRTQAASATGKPIRVKPISAKARSTMVGENLRAAIPAVPVKDRELNDLVKRVDKAAPDDV